MMRIVLISGLSGSGKSIALGLLEDIGFICIDNLPVKLLPELITYYTDNQASLLGISVDIRSRFNPTEVKELIISLRKQGHRVDILFLTASENVLLQRFSETRRSHPLLQEQKTLKESVTAERQYLSTLQNYGYVIDTSSLNVQQLRWHVQQWVNMSIAPMHIVLESFGYKYGVPTGLDFVFDMRCLPNPFYDHQLRPYTGLDEPIKIFFSQQPIMTNMINDLSRFLLHWLPKMEEESRTYVNIGIGCTGGQHRSVYVVETLAKNLNKYAIIIRHRQLEISQRCKKTL